MPIPFLAYGAVAAVVGIAAVVFSDDDSSSSDSSGRDYNAEREGAEQEALKKEYDCYKEQQIDWFAKKYGIRDKALIKQALEEAGASVNPNIDIVGLLGALGGFPGLLLAKSIGPNKRAKADFIAKADPLDKSNAMRDLVDTIDLKESELDMLYDIDEMLDGIEI